jgi:hypothetical protein
MRLGHAYNPAGCFIARSQLPRLCYSCGVVVRLDIRPEAEISRLGRSMRLILIAVKLRKLAAAVWQVGGDTADPADAAGSERPGVVPNTQPCQLT